MKISYKSKKLEKELTDDRKLMSRYGELAKKIKQRLNELRAFECLEDAKKLPILRLHEHIGAGKGNWSVDIYKNWRIIFIIKTEPIPRLEDGGIDKKNVREIEIIEIVDPH